MSSQEYTAMVNEIVNSLQAFAKTGLRGFAQKAYDRCQAIGMTETSIGRVEEWDAAYAVELADYLAND